jgi:hypothetical protein
MSKDELNQGTVSTSSTRGDIIRFYTSFLLFAFCVLIYYFGELIEFAEWDSLKNITFFFGVHDIHRLFFLAPIMYAGYYFGVRAAIIMTILSVGSFIPRALFLSPYPDPILRTALFSLTAGIVGYLFAVTSTGYRKSRRQSSRSNHNGQQ